jgi:hypothetical protein
MGCSTRIAVGLALGIATTGCVTGHLLETARRWERVRSFEQASVDGERLFVRYLAEVTDDSGEALGERHRQAMVALGPLRGARVVAEEVHVERIRDDRTLPGRRVPIVRAPPPEGGGPVSLVLDDEALAVAPIPGNAFTTVSTAGWAYPLIPVALCADATSLPVLLFFAPGAMVIGD